MSYYTEFELTWDENLVAEDDVILALTPYIMNLSDEDMAKLTEPVHPMRITQDFVKELDRLSSKVDQVRSWMRGEDHVHWRTWESDMLKVSGKFPDVMFELQGYGERKTDIWKARFLDGRSEVVKAEIVYPKFARIMEEGE